MSTSAPNRSRSLVPHWGWGLLAAVVLVVAYPILSIWLPYHREQNARHKIYEWGGQIGYTRNAAPVWLRRVAGRDPIQILDRVISIDLRSTTISDSDLDCLKSISKVE